MPAIPFYVAHPTANQQYSSWVDWYHAEGRLGALSADERTALDELSALAADELAETYGATRDDLGG